MIHLIPTYTFVAILTASAVSAKQPQPLTTTTSSTLLAEELVRVAHQATMSDPLNTVAIEAAVALITEASVLSPEDVTIWRSLHEIAQMADLPDLSHYAIQNLLRVAPVQPSAQLARLRDVINKAQTLDKRLQLYEVILSQENRSSLDGTVAARLALDAAYLQRQAGNVPQFARWLAESVARDPSYHDAMTLAAGFFGDESADVFTRAELLAAASLSNIKDQTTMIALAEFLMAFGDYQDAKYLYEIVLGNRASSPSAISDTLLADIVLSQWAAGDTEAAMATLMERQSAQDKKFRVQTKRQQPRLDPLELARIHAPLVPKLATVRAAIYASQDDAAQTEMALESAISSIISVSKIYESQGDAALIKVAELYMQAAWIMLWMGDGAESAEIFIKQVETGAIIHPSEKQRLEGWIAFRKGDLSLAKTKLEPMKQDPSAKIGMALIYLEEGNKKAAAIELLSVAKSNGGTILGVWSKNKLEKIVGTQFQIRSEIDQLQQLMSGVLQTISTLVHDPRPPVGLSVVPESVTLSPYEPIWVKLEITNNAPVPMMIASNGPIQPLVLLETIIPSSTEKTKSIPPIVVPIDNELSIKPRGKTSVYIDLRKYWIGGFLNTQPLRGASFSLQAIVNFTARETKDRQGVTSIVYEQGRLGQQATTSTIRINGIRLTDKWLEQALEDIQEVSDTQDLITFVLLTWAVLDGVFVEVVEPPITPPPGEEVVQLKEGERHPNQDKAITTLLTTFPKLNPTDQAWVLSTMSTDPTIEAVKGMLKEPNSTKSQLAWIIRFITPNVPDEALDDPLLLSALKSDNKQVQTVAVWVYAWVQGVIDLRNKVVVQPK